MNRISLLLAALLMSAAGLAESQSVSRLQDGDRIRVRSVNVSGEFTVIESSAGLLRLRNSAAGSTVDVPVSSISRLHVNRGPRSRRSGTLRGFTAGLAIGAGTGAIAGYMDGDDEPGIVSFSSEEKAVMGALVFGGMGAVAGALIGNFSPGTIWEPLRDFSSVRLAPTARGGMTLALSRRF